MWKKDAGFSRHNRSETIMIDNEKLDNALRVMGKRHLKPLYRDDWSPDHPRDGYCYVIAEVMYHYLAPDGFMPCIAKSGENGETHWFLRKSGGEVIDPTNIESRDGDNEFYQSGRLTHFMTAKISQRGQILADLLGLTNLLR